MGKGLQRTVLAALFLVGLAVFCYPYAQGLLVKREMESTVQTFQEQKMIDVTKYSKIEYVENTTGSTSSIYVTKNRTGNYSSIMLAKIDASPGDISGISGEVYFVISTANGRESTFNNIYLVV